jgi:hypothetical protein
MHVTASHLIELGVSRETLEEKVKNGEWKTLEPFQTGKESEREILLSSLPRELQIKWAQLNPLTEYPEQIAILLSEAAEHGLNEHPDEIEKLLAPLSQPERRAWMEEALRMVKIVGRYAQMKPKRQRDSATGAWEFAAGVVELCQETVCRDYLILSRHPHKVKPLAPHTLDDLHRDYRKRGMVVFLPKIKKEVIKKHDKRRATISGDAVTWVNKNWRRFSGARFLYKALVKEAKKWGWKIPKESWFFRRWEERPEIVKTVHQEGKNAYVSKYAPYVPRDYSDLQALQVVCGDHSLRDLTVLLPDGIITRPALTCWLDLRTYLIWGWHLSVSPSSHTAALAYANGVRTFGAQPPSRHYDGYYSFIYTDLGRDFRARNWDGMEIYVSKEEMTLDTGLELLLAERRVGIVDELNLRHMLARAYNAREKPVERVFKMISEWERNSFKEYCGRDAKHKPDTWQELYRQHQRQVNKGNASSPFIPFEQYRERLAEFIDQFNSTAHQRQTLGSESVIPIEAYKRLYTTRYDIREKTLALLIMKPTRKKIGKLGVECFRRGWFYYHEAMSEYKRRHVEVRYSEDDYSRVFVVLPNSQICEAQLITPTSIINPDQRKLQFVQKITAHEKAVIRDFELIKQSSSRGETVEDRAAQLLGSYAEESEDTEDSGAETRQSNVYQWTRFERKRLYPVAAEREVKKEDVAGVEADMSIFDATPVKRFDEFD